MLFYKALFELSELKQLLNHLKLSNSTWARSNRPVPRARCRPLDQDPTANTHPARPHFTTSSRFSRRIKIQRPRFVTTFGRSEQPFHCGPSDLNQMVTVCGRFSFTTLWASALLLPRLDPPLFSPRLRRRRWRPPL